MQCSWIWWRKKKTTHFYGCLFCRGTGVGHCIMHAIRLLSWLYLVSSLFWLFYTIHVPLHIKCAFGQITMYHHIICKDIKIIRIQNKNNEPKLFRYIFKGTCDGTKNGHHGSHIHRTLNSCLICACFCSCFTFCLLYFIATANSRFMLLLLLLIQMMVLSSSSSSSPSLLLLLLLLLSSTHSVHTPNMRSSFIPTDGYRKMSVLPITIA